MNNNTSDHVIKPRPSSGIIYLLVAVLAGLVACAAPPSPHLRHPSLSLRRPDIKTVGLLPPTISVYEEHYAFGKNKPVLQEEWSKAARESLIRACTEAAAAKGWKLVLLSTDDPELRDMAQLYNAVDFSIQRHALVVKGRSKQLGNLFPEKIRSFDYTLGPSQGAMERNKVDAVWIVRGFNLVPSSGLGLQSVPEGAMWVFISALGTAASIMTLNPAPVAVGPSPLQKLGLSSALVDQSGSILSYSIFDDARNERSREERTGSPPAVGELEPIRPAEPPTYLDVDLRDPRVAGHYMKAALAGYAAGARP